MVDMNKWTIKIKDQPDNSVHFQIFHDGKLDFDNPRFNKDELIELITEGNYNLSDEEIRSIKKLREMI